MEKLKILKGKRFSTSIEDSVCQVLVNCDQLANHRDGARDMWPKYIVSRRAAKDSVSAIQDLPVANPLIAPLHTALYRQFRLVELRHKGSHSRMWRNVAARGPLIRGFTIRQHHLPPQQPRKQTARKLGDLRVQHSGRCNIEPQKSRMIGHTHSYFDFDAESGLLWVAVEPNLPVAIEIVAIRGLWRVRLDKDRV